MKRYDPISLLQPGGYQPYDGSSAQMPGMALAAMLAGRGAMGNPADVQRDLHAAAGHLTLLSRLMGEDSGEPRQPDPTRADILRIVRSR